MGIGTAMIVGALTSALSANIEHNRAGDPAVSGTVIKAPASSLDEDKEKEVNLGSSRSKDRDKRSSGRRKLMAGKGQASPAKASTGLQI